MILISFITTERTDFSAQTLWNLSQYATGQENVTFRFSKGKISEKNKGNKCNAYNHKTTIHESLRGEQFLLKKDKNTVCKFSAGFH